LLGDYNRDGIVDSADYVTWRRTLNTSVAPFSGADGNGDGTVTSADYSIWRANFGRAHGGGSGGGESESSSLTTDETSMPTSASSIIVTAQVARQDQILATGSAVLVPAADDEAAASNVEAENRVSSSAIPLLESTRTVVIHRPASRPRVEFAASRSDSALLAWLESNGDAPAADPFEDGSRPADGLMFDDSDDEALDAVDFAFEALAVAGLAG